MGGKEIQISVKLMRFVSKSHHGEPIKLQKKFVRIACLFSFSQKITKTDLKETEINVVFNENIKDR